MVGYDAVAALVKRLGTSMAPKPYPSIALGSFEATPFEIATAYTVFPNLGQLRPLHAIQQINADDKQVAKPAWPSARTVTRPETAFLVANMMRSVINEGTAASVRGAGFALDAAGKTGTTNDLRDAWFVGFTPELLTVVWVGFDDNTALGLSGAQAALPIWTTFMMRALAGRPNVPLPQPETLVWVDIDRDNGRLALAGCPRVIREAFLPGTEPTETCDARSAPVASQRRDRRSWAPMNDDVFRVRPVAARRIGSAGERWSATACTIVSTSGSTPQRVGARMLVYEDGRTVGTIGGGCYENDASGKAREAIRLARPQLARYSLNDDLAAESGLICGGQMEVFIEPVVPTPDLYLLGAGHVSMEVARVASTTGFRVHVVDDREKFANADRFPGAEVVVDDIPTWLHAVVAPARRLRRRRHARAPPRSRGACGRWPAGRLRYLGLIGSRAKVHADLRSRSRAKASPRPARRDARADRPRYRRGHARRDRGQHRGRTGRRALRTDRGPARRGRGAEGVASALIIAPVALSWPPPAESCIIRA